MKNSILQLWALIKNTQKIVLISHIRMDMDTFWSTCALYCILKKIGKNVVAVNDEAPPESFAFLWVNHVIQNNVDIASFQPELIISLDAASLGQLWKTYENNKNIFLQTDFVVIDHHISNHWFWKINIVNPESSSTCELLFDIIESLGYTYCIDAQVATLLNAGIITDTNMYYNVNTTSHTLLVASKLLEYGSDFRAPMFEFYKKKWLAKSRLWGEILKDIQTYPIDFPDGRKNIVWAKVPQELFEKTGTSSHEISWIVNEFLANIENTELWFIVYPLEDGGIKASFRSQNFDVSAFSSQFWWGGHKQAAGFTLYNETLDSVETIILEKFWKKSPKKGN